MTEMPILYRPDVEQMHDDEEQTIEELNSTFDFILERTANDYGHAVRAVHAKSHGILQGELTVHGGLPAELAQGLFATPGTHKVWLRLSTNAGDMLPDAISLPRGLAMKVFDVQGERYARFHHDQRRGFSGTDYEEVLGKSQAACQNDGSTRGNEEGHICHVAGCS